MLLLIFGSGLGVYLLLLQSEYSKNSFFKLLSYYNYQVVLTMKKREPWTSQAAKTNVTSFGSWSRDHL